MVILLNNNNKLYILCFVDNQIMLAQNHDDLENMARKLIENYNKSGLEVNIAKTKTMYIENLFGNVKI